MNFFKKLFFVAMAIIGILFIFNHNENMCACAQETKISGGSINKVTVKKIPKLLDLGAHKCIPCQKMAPILDELTLKYKGLFDVEFIDVWNPENREKAMKHNIKSIPTQIFFDEKEQELWRHVGYFSKEEIMKKWKELGYVFELEKTEKALLKKVVSEGE